MSRRKMRRIAGGGLLAIVLIGGAVTWATAADSASVLSTTPLPTPGGAASVGVDERTSRVVVVGSGATGSVTILDATTGQPVHSVPLDGRVSGPAAAAISPATGHTFVLNTYGPGIAPGATVSMLDTRMGAPVRTIRVPPEPWAVAVDDRDAWVFVTSIGAAPVVGNARGGGRVSMVDARSGALLRTVAVGRMPEAVAVDTATRRVFVANFADNTVSVLDAVTGAVVWTASVGAHPIALAVAAGTGRVFVANEDSQSVSTLDARSGRVLRTTPVGYPSAMAVDARTGRVLVANVDNGTVSVLDAASGALVQTLTVGGSPSALAIDARTDHAFVTSTQSNRPLYMRLHSIVHIGLSWLDEGNNAGMTVLDIRRARVRVLRTVRVGAAPQGGIAVDARVGHVFVVGAGGARVSMLDAAR